MTRPTQLHVGSVLYWVISTRDPDTMVLKDADSTPSVSVRKNGAAVGDSVTVTKRAATTGLYDCSYDPAGEAEADQYTLEESATVTGTTTASATYRNQFVVRVVSPVQPMLDKLPTATYLTGTEDADGAAGLDSATLQQLDDIEAAIGEISGGTDHPLATNG